MNRVLFLVGGCVLLSLISSARADPAGAEARPVDFNRDIRPILSDACFTCHGPAKGARKAGLRLDTEEGAFADLDGKKAIVPSKLADSELWKRIAHAQPGKRMPPPRTGKKLTPKQIDLVKQWIEQGATWAKHWSFIPPARPVLPAVKNPSWARNPIDRYILAGMQENGLQPSPEAARATLIRRLSYDLTGLPPTLADIDAFLADQAPDAYDRLVDRLLASPRYGERMVLDWLDAARYSDTNGYQTDGTRPMWPWRDWVIAALNKNMPFDQFTLEQIAGDMLPAATVKQKIATGFNRNHMLNGEGGRIAEESRVEYVVDRVETTATVWLGMTAGCGRCHDHKYDPLSQKEFYGLYAYFNNISESGSVDRRSSTAAPIIELPTAEQQKKIAAETNRMKMLDGQLKSITDKLRAGQGGWEKTVPRDKLPGNVAEALKIPADKRKPEQAKAVTDHYLSQAPEWRKAKQELDATSKALQALKNSVLVTMVMEERPQPRDTFLLIRGSYDKYGDKVQPGIPACLPPLPKEAPNNRLGLARWLVDRGNPLTARVTVNRHWQMFFGTGLVKTSEDFGSQGAAPSHPELLDWLAVEFMSNWDMKALHRLIVTSATYRQSSRVSDDTLDKDTDNRYLSRGPRHRLNAFMLRDQALALSGLLVEKLGGPPVRPYQPKGIWEEFSFGQIRYPQDKGENLYRRSLYTFWRRSVGPPNLFDTSARQVCTVRPSRTNTPTHALTLMNDVTFVEAARVWAEGLMKQGRGPEDRLALAFRAATGRQPTTQERSTLLQGFKRTLQQYRNDKKAAAELIAVGEYPRDMTLDVVELAAYTGMANMILNLDEAVCKE